MRFGRSIFSRRPSMDSLLARACKPAPICPSVSLAALRGLAGCPFPVVLDGSMSIPGSNDAADDEAQGERADQADLGALLDEAKGAVVGILEPVLEILDPRQMLLDTSQVVPCLSGI